MTFEIWAIDKSQWDASVYMTVIDSDTDLSPRRHEAIVCINAGSLPNGPVRANVSESWITAKEYPKIKFIRNCSPQICRQTYDHIW